jgi:hypothetical protein
MKNYLIITIGTRDVQLRKDLLETLPGWNLEPRKKGTFEVVAISKGGVEIEANYNKDFPEFYTCSPRIAGRVITDNLSLFKGVVDFPLIKPVLDNLLIKGIEITNVLLIYTDQQSGYAKGAVKANNYNNDTIYFKEIVQNLISEHPLLVKADFDDYVIWEQVANIDYQYDHFAEAHKDLLLGDPEQINQIYLLPQGGIDQINQAITLQLIQAFKHKVKLLQKAEGVEVQELKFTSKFLNDLNKQKVLKHLEDYDFGMIDKNLHSNRQVYHLAQYAAKRQNLQYDLLSVNLPLLADYQYPIPEDIEEVKILDLYLAAKINLHQRRHTEFLWKLYTLNETLYKNFIKKIVGIQTEKHTKISSENRNEHTAWEKALIRIDATLPSKISAHLMPNGQPVDCRNPNRQAFKVLFREFFRIGFFDMTTVKFEIYNRVDEKLEALSSERNNIAHKLGSTSIAQINSILIMTEKEYTTKNLLSDLDQLFDLQTPYGIYDQIKADIETLLDQPY